MMLRRLPTRRRPRASAEPLARPLARPLASQRAVDAALRTLLGAAENAPLVPRATAEQARAVDLALRGFSVFLRLPTGAGKSLAFQAPALAAAPPSATIVASPLVALVQDQVAALARRGVRALRLTGDDRRRRADTPLDELLRDQRLVYTTPEFLVQNDEMRRWLARAAEQARVARLVLDEAHCVLEWGAAFRPAYLELARWRARRLPGVPVTLASASVADEDVARLADVFGLELVRSADADADAALRPNANRLVLVERLADRPNLSIAVLRKPARAAAALIAERVRGAPAIVYCLTRSESEAVSLELARLGCRAGAYHGGMPRTRREFVRKQWMAGRLSVICATSAFGMGIDRPDVRFVVHHSLPLSLSAYLQQIGRAGRDGDPAECVLLYSPEDKARAEGVAAGRGDDDGGTGRTTSRSSQADLMDVVAFCELPRGACRKEALYAHFGTPFERGACAERCNCLVRSEPAAPDAGEADGGLGWRSARANPRGAAPDVGASKAAVEYQYQRVAAERKRRGLPKRESLSRRVVKEILDKPPASLEEMANMKGVGLSRARLYFDLFPSER